MGRLEELEVFAAIADLGSLIGAARRTRRSAPAVTRILRDLETRLGVRLVERTTRSLGLTDAGSRLAENVRRLLCDLRHAEAEASGEALVPRGCLRISAPLVFGRRHVAPLLMKFLDDFPEVTAELSLADRIVDLVEDGFDLALRIGDLDVSSYIRRKVGSVRMVLVGSPSYLERRGRPIAPDDLADHHFVIFSRGRTRPEVQLQDRDVIITQPLVGRFHVDQAEAAIAAAVEGKGLLATLSYQVTEHVAAGRLVRLLEAYEPPPLPVQFVFPTARLMTPKVRAFLNFAVPKLSALDDVQDCGSQGLLKPSTPSTTSPINRRPARGGD
ncbi:LysR family transcriptional regulator [Taklimakanibacter deserti]|uniref:LysR family transcriptional regulator n=1 Tax=Taklimakanibacter deserti TaxID=2267839 RepID=UPI000E64D227